MHDRIAELAGLRAELDICQNGPRESRREDAEGVQKQLDRVRGELDKQAEGLEKQAKQLLGEGRDGLAGQATEEARAIRDALKADQPQPVDEKAEDDQADEAEDEDEAEQAEASPKRRGKRTTTAAKAPENR